VVIFFPYLFSHPKEYLKFGSWALSEKLHFPTSVSRGFEMFGGKKKKCRTSGGGKQAQENAESLSGGESDEARL